MCLWLAAFLSGHWSDESHQSNHSNNFITIQDCNEKCNPAATCNQILPHDHKIINCWKERATYAVMKVYEKLHGMSYYARSLFVCSCAKLMAIIIRCYIPACFFNKKKSGLSTWVSLPSFFLDALQITPHFSTTWNIIRGSLWKEKQEHKAHTFIGKHWKLERRGVRLVFTFDCKSHLRVVGLQGGWSTK